MGGTRAERSAYCAAGGATRGRGLWAHLGKLVSRLLLPIERHPLDQAGAPLLAQPVAVAANGDHVAVMQQPVEDGGGDYRIAEHRAPVTDAAVAGDHQAAALVALRDQLEEQMRRVRRERQIAPTRRRSTASAWRRTSGGP